MIAWANFYVIVGSAGAALVGLHGAHALSGRRKPPNSGAVEGFSTPSVMYLASATVLSALTNVPWVSMTGVAVVLAGVGLGGLVYAVNVGRIICRQTDYQPDRDDWFWYVALPFVAFATLTLTAFLLPARRQFALLGIGTVRRVTYGS